MLMKYLVVNNMIDIEKIIKIVNKKNIVKRFLLFTFSLFISACSFNLLERPAQIVTGGSTGISIITEFLFNMKPSDTVLTISICSVILSVIFLDKQQTIGALISTILFPFFVNLTTNITNYVTVDMSDLLLVSIFIGVISGFVNGLVYKSGFSSGGLSVIAHILYRYFKISRTTTSFVTNGILVFLGGFLFGWPKAMYAIIILYLYSIVADKVLLGISSNKNVLIITDKDKEIKQYIINEIKTGLTEFDIKGGFKLRKRKALMTVVSNNNYFKLKHGIKHIDSNSFLIVTDSYNVFGGR